MEIPPENPNTDATPPHQKNLLALKQKALQWRREGKSLSDVRHLLASEANCPEESIAAIIQEIDRIELIELEKKELKKQLISRMIIGGCVSAFGVIITLILHNKQPIKGLMFVYTFGPMIVGYVLFKVAFQKYKKLQKNED